jgi:hypothetical protein
MATTIYKVSKYKNWQGKGVELMTSTVGGIGSVDLSNYYTKNELQTVFLAIVNAANVISAPFQIITFADPLEIDATTYKDWICSSVTGSTTINLNNTVDGDAGQIELVIDGTGGYTLTLGTMFTKQLGDTVLVATANADNIISWRMIGTDILYVIDQVV